MIRKAVTVVRHLVLTQSVQSPSVSQEVQHCIEKRASLPLTGTLSHFLLNHLSSHDQIFKVLHYFDIVPKTVTLVVFCFLVFRQRDMSNEIDTDSRKLINNNQ